MTHDPINVNKTLLNEHINNSKTKYISTVAKGITIRLVSKKYKENFLKKNKVIGNVPICAVNETTSNDQIFVISTLDILTKSKIGLY